MNDIEKLIEYYINLLIIQYHNKPKARATIRVFIAELVALYSLIKEVEKAFDLNYAIGNQLDIVGKYFGVVRNFVGLQFGYNYFTMQYMGGDDEGVSFRTLQNEGLGKFRTLLGEKTYQYDLDDEQFRILIKLRAIALHNESLSYEYIPRLVEYLLSGQVYVVTHTDMSIDYYFKNRNLLQVFETYGNLLPAPAGVKVNVYSMQDSGVTFTLKALTLNGGTAYNIFQCGMQSLASPLEDAKWNILPINEEETA